MSFEAQFPSGSEPLYLIDGSSYIYRGFYAFGDLTRSDGFPTNALYIVMRLAIKLLREKRPRRAAFVVDGPGPSFRSGVFPAYKAQRQKMPEPLALQIEPIRQGVALLGFAVVSEEAVEADDTIASLAARHKKQMPVVIVGSDKDLRQCLDEEVVLWDPSGKEERLVTLEDFRAGFPAGPDRWPDFQALTGDSSDNIPGVPGVGPKTAAEIMADFPSLERLKEGIGQLKPAWRKKIEPHLEDVFLYRELTRLKLDAARDISLAGLAVSPAPAQQVLDFLKMYELRSLMREFSAQANVHTPQESLVQTKSAPKKKGRPGQEERLSLFGAPAGPETAAAEESAPLPDPVPLSGIPSFAGLEAAVVPAGEGFLLAAKDKDQSKEWFVSAKPSLVAPLLATASSVATPSLKELLSKDSAWKSVPLGRWFDVSLAAYLLAPEDRLYSWGRLLDALWSDPGFDRDEAPGRANGLACLALARRQRVKLDQAGLTRLLHSLELPLVPVLVDMEQAGITIDKPAFAAFAAQVNAELAELTGRMERQAGTHFNLRSSQQLADVLYKRLGLKAPGKTPGGAASTSAEVLERLAGQHPLVDSILEFRKLEKLRSTYLEPLPALADASGRIHTTFNQLTTATGRLSSSAPNLQNIPVRDDLGKRMRALFTAGPGSVLASADYSQIELRVLAHFSGDPALTEAFRQGEDIHAHTASLLFDKLQDDVTASERRQAKTVNFGLLYGMGPQKLGRELGMTLAAAKDFIAKYFERLSVLKSYYQQIVQDAKANGYVTTLAGRRRLLPEIHSRNTQLEAQARRQAINTVIQGSAADIIKMAMLRVAADETLASLSAKLILQVHDELVLEAPEKHGQTAGERLRELMITVVTLDVPVVADLGVARDWSGAH